MSDKVSNALLLWTAFFIMVGTIALIIGKSPGGILAFSSALVTSILSWILRREWRNFENGTST